MKKKVKSIWISDVHLGTKGCQAKKLKKFLKQYQCENLFLVGDIIDGWKMKRKIHFPQQHQNVIRIIMDMAKHGTNVIYVTGNHDEFLRDYVDYGINFGNIKIVNEYQYISNNGKTYLITHGDEYDGIVKYHKWLAFLGDMAYELAISINRHINKIREYLEMPYWSLSKFLKHKVKEAVSFIFEYEDAIIHECSKRDFDGVICGHIHHVELREVVMNDKTFEYVNCGDWVESCTAIIEDYEGVLSVYEYDKENN